MRGWRETRLLGEKSAGQFGASARAHRSRRWLVFAGRAAAYLGAALVTLWALLALHFDLPIAKLRDFAAVAYFLGVVAVCICVRRAWRRLLVCLLCFGGVLAWWLQIKPSDQGPWQPDVSQTAWASVQGNLVTIHNFRSCDYRTEGDYTCQWLTVPVELDKIQGVDLFMDYWDSPWIAHTILSFDLEDGRHVAFSIETRKRPGQSYSAIRGFFRQYTLISVVSDERDVVRLRTNYRQHEDLYLYHTKSTPAFARDLFMNYIAFTNDLHNKPQWYNAITHNCTTEIYTFSTMKSQRWDWRILLNGKADKMEYDRGQLAGNLPWPELKRRAYINPAARAADNDQDFSALIRKGRPGFGAPQAERRRFRARGRLQRKPSLGTPLPLMDELYTKELAGMELMTGPDYLAKDLIRA